MLRVDLRAAEPGMALALPVRNPHDIGQLLLKVGYALTDYDIARLKEFNIQSVWIRCPSLDVLDKFFSEDVVNCQNQVVRKIADTFQQLQDHVNPKLSFQTYRGSIRDLIGHLVRNPQAAIFLDGLSDSGADGLVGHSARVTYLSLLMGLKLEGYLVRQRKRIHPAIAKEVTALGLGAMLHDIGVVELPAHVYDRYVETGDESDPVWRQHPSLGYDKVRGRIEPSAATIVLNHHQCYDGSGYGGSRVPVLDQNQIHVFSRIVGLADQFDRLLHPPNLPPLATVAALKLLLCDTMLRKFDPHVVRSLLTVVPPYPPGSLVRLSDGRCGVCVDHIPVDPCRPVVLIVPDIDHIDPNETYPGETVALYEDDEDIFVSHCDGEDVSEHNFPTPALMRDQSQGLILKRRGRIGLL